MPFSEKVKLEVRKKAWFRCAICHQEFVEVHHIVPESEGGGNDPENAAPLCATCHDLFGDNPRKRKQIRQMRDHWYELMEKRCRGEVDLFDPIKKEPENMNLLKDRSVALYHVVYEYEDFETAAQDLVGLLKTAQAQRPNERRVLYLDIDGHRNEMGGFDWDMLELQGEFLLGFLMRFFSEIHTPLIGCANNQLQDNDVPEALVIFDGDEAGE